MRTLWMRELRRLALYGAVLPLAALAMTLVNRDALALKRDAWFLGMGDYIDFLSPSGRQKIAAAGHYEAALKSIDDRALDLMHEVYAMFLKPTKGRWLGMLEGHHFAQLRDGTTTDMRLDRKSTRLNSSHRL